MLELIIVRHGQSVADIERRYEGRADFPLTDLGREQATKLASWLNQKYPPNFILSSPLKRTSETAEIISSEVNIEVKYGVIHHSCLQRSERNGYQYEKTIVFIFGNLNSDFLF